MIKTPLDSTTYQNTEFFTTSTHKIQAEIATLRNRRETNEDAAIVLQCGKYVVAAIADGLGGHPHGELASATVVQALEALPELDLTAEAGPTLYKHLTGIRDQLQSHGDNRDSTLTCAFIAGKKVLVAQVGDCRAFIDGTFEETERQGYENWVSHTMGTLKRESIGWYLWDIDRDFTLMLCTDGLDGIESKACMEFVSGNQVIDLCNLATKSSHDNTTAIMIRATKHV